MSDDYTDFDLDAPKLPKPIKQKAFSSGGFPYAERLDKDQYESELHDLQLELVKLQDHLLRKGERVVIVLEGRDAAGKSSTIGAYREHLNPRTTIPVALPKPSDRERTQWYFQRYVDHLPTASETVMFDRSWYNRAVVEPVMGFCTQQEADAFLEEAPRFERMIVKDGIHLFKLWLSIGREMQMQRFWERRQDPLKQWKLSPVDVEALGLWDAYSKAIERMLATTDSPEAPWIVVRSNDQRRARLNTIRAILERFDYAGKNPGQVGQTDRKIILGAEEFVRAGV